MTYSKKELISYRLERAKESYEDGKLLASRSRWNSAANRLYYACFYIVSAYLAKREIRATTHAGLKTAFNKELEAISKMFLMAKRQDFGAEQGTKSAHSRSYVSFL